MKWERCVVAILISLAIVSVSGTSALAASSGLACRSQVLSDAAALDGESVEPPVIRQVVQGWAEVCDLGSGTGTAAAEINVNGGAPGPTQQTSIRDLVGDDICHVTGQTVLNWKWKLEVHTDAGNYNLPVNDPYVFGFAHENRNADPSTYGEAHGVLGDLWVVEDQGTAEFVGIGPVTGPAHVDPYCPTHDENSVSFDFQGELLNVGSDGSPCERLPEGPVPCVYLTATGMICTKTCLPVTDDFGGTPVT